MPTTAIAEKLQPPIIDSTIPAFCKEFIQVSPSANSSAAGYYEYVNGSYVLSTDTEIVNDKVYYACQIKITVPFIHSKTYVPAGSDSDISYSFNLKIKTAQSNNYIATATDPDVLNNQAVFYIRDASENRTVFQRFKVGQYYKFQMAYVKTTRDSSTNTTTSVVGFYSTVATGKYTQQPTVEIQQYDIHKINYFSSVCTGVYVNPDVTEKPYQFKFILSKDNNVIEDSDWQMHNFSIDDIVNSVNYVYRDTYTFETDIEPQEKYKVKYCVKTINNYEIQSEEYNVALVYVEDVRQIMDLVAENDFDNGYITLKFQTNKQKALDSIAQTYESAKITKVEDSDYLYVVELPEIGGSRTAFANGSITPYLLNSFEEVFDYKSSEHHLQPVWRLTGWRLIGTTPHPQGRQTRDGEVYDNSAIYYLQNGGSSESVDALDYTYLIENGYLRKRIYQKDLSLYLGTLAGWNFVTVFDIRNVFDFLPNAAQGAFLHFKYLPLSILIERADDRDDFASWQKIDIINLSSSFELSSFSYRDYTIEQGIFYQYRYSLCDRNGYTSLYSLSDVVYSDFEDMFLYDGNKQVKIRFNPKVSSFKQTILEQKMDTIGSKYPFFFRNGNVKYREFPLNGLISFNMDDDETNQFLPLDKKIYVSNHNDVLMNKRIFTAVKDDQYFLNLGVNAVTIRKIQTQTERDILYYYPAIDENDKPSSIHDLIRVSRDFDISNFWTATTYQYYELISLYDRNLKFEEISEDEVSGCKNPVYYSANIPWSNIALTLVDDNTQINSDYHYYELKHISNENLPRDETPSYQEIRSNIFATSLTGYTVRVEREYKMALLEWLNSGTIKMFKSPYEGNFIVRLMNVSLTPQDQLGRMIHSFQCQAYEVADFNYNNLTAIGIGNTTDFLDAIGSLYADKDGTIIEVGEININEENGVLVPVINESSENIPEEEINDYIVDTGGATATSRDIRSGKTAYARGLLIVGSLQQGDEIGFGNEVGE